MNRGSALAVGVAMGIALGIAMHNLALGLAMGLALGLGMGRSRVTSWPASISRDRAKALLAIMTIVAAAMLIYYNMPAAP